MGKRIAIAAGAALALFGTCPGAEWKIDGDMGIVREAPRGVSDSFEMSSRGVDAVVKWGVAADGAWRRTAKVRFPTLRTERDDTYGCWEISVPDDAAAEARIDGRELSRGTVSRVKIGPALVAEVDHRKEGLAETRTLFPAATATAFLESVELRNMGDAAKTVEIAALSSKSEGKGIFGCLFCDSFVAGAGRRLLAPGASVRYTRCVAARGENAPLYYPDVEAEFAARLALWREASETLVLETPSPEIDAMFRFAKFRTLESLYATRAGLIHSPGGAWYLAAIWANDQAEYACPLLAQLGTPSATEAMKTCFRWFAQRMNDEWKPIPSSIIAENRSYWNGRGDRGDMAMMAHGATRSALSLGDEAFAEEMKPFVLWCLEFGRRKIGADGVVASDSDELEGRLPSGKANLCTSALQYDALSRAADMTGDRRLRDEAHALEAAIERYFGAKVEGFDTYRYYEGNDVLRSWIGIPLCFGIDRRAKATADAIFSDRLWDGTGTRSVSGAPGYWDRSTLYAFRGIAFCGLPDLALPRIEEYVRDRLLGRHVPYPVEYGPKGGRQLSAESALFARVFTEGFFGITPTGLRSFSAKPSMPKGWRRMALKNMRAHGAEFDIEIVRSGGKLRLRISEGKPSRCVLERKLDEGAETRIEFPLRREPPPEAAPAPAAADFSAKRVFRPERFTRGATNMAKDLQPIDDATWIWMDGISMPPALANETRPSAQELASSPYFFLKFRKAFEAVPGERLELDVSADERFALYLDGRLVARGPHRGLPNHWNYQSYAIDLPPGGHVMEAVVTRLGVHAPLAQLSLGGGFVLKASGRYDEQLTTGKAAWKVARLHNTRMTDKGISRTFGVGSQCVVEGCDASREEPEPSAWRDAVPVRQSVKSAKHVSAGLIVQGWMLYPSDMPDQLHEVKSPGAFVAARRDGDFCGEWSAEDASAPEVAAFNLMLAGGGAATIPANTSVRLLWNLGDYFCGYPQLTTSGGKGAKVSWGWAESLRAQGKKRSRDAFAGLRMSQAMIDDFMTDGRKGAFFSTPWWRCGKWVELRISTGGEPLVVEGAAIDETRYPYRADASSFECGDASAGVVAALCRRGMEACSHEMLFDCPFYEQQMYGGDGRVELLTSALVDSDDRLARHAIDLFDFDRRENGMVAMNTPTRGTQESATYAMCWPMMLADAAMWRDSPAWLRARLPGLSHTLAGLAMYENAEGFLENLPGWCFVDWVKAPGWNHGAAPGGAAGCGVSSVNNLFYLADMQAAATVFAALGMDDDAALWRAKAKRLAAKIVERFWCEKRGLLADDADGKHFSEHANALALVLDALPPDKASMAMEGLAADKDLARCTVYFSHYLFEAYLKRGRTDLFLEKLDLWRSFAKAGAKTPFESPGNDTVRSDCHAWGAHPLYHFHHGVAGVEPSSPFFGTVMIAPKPSPLAWYRSKTPHPKGAIVQDMRFADGRATGTITLPAGLSGVFEWRGRTVPLSPGRQTVDVEAPLGK